MLAGARFAAAQSLTVLSDALVGKGPEGRSIQEPHLAIDPRDPDHIAAAVMVVPPFGAAIGEQHCAAYVSTNGGMTWSRHDFPVSGCYDPWLVFLPDGALLFSSLGTDSAVAGEGNGLLVYRSPDGGRTWTRRPAGLSWGWDHPMLVVDWSSSKRHGWVYLVSSRDLHKGSGFYVAVARSIDGGKTFDAPHNVAPENQVIKAEPPVVLSDGTLVVPYVELEEYGNGLLRRKEWVVRSTNGIDFSPATLAGDPCGPPPDFLLSSFAVDPGSQTFRDQLYFACTRAGLAGVAVTHSADRGASWTPPVSATGDPNDLSSSRALMATAVSSTGVYGVVWLDLPKSGGCRDVYLSASFDGGESYTPPLRVSEQSSCPSSKLNGPHGGYGDYFALAGDSRGRFRVVWADARTGLFQLRTALIGVNASAPHR